VVLFINDIRFICCFQAINRMDRLRASENTRTRYHVICEE